MDCDAAEPGVEACCGDAAGVAAFRFCAGGGAHARIRNRAEVKMTDATVLALRPE
jgi:hypothetical protein